MYEQIVKIMFSILIVCFFLIFYVRYKKLLKRNDNRIEELENRITDLLSQYNDEKSKDAEDNAVVLELLNKCYLEQREINKDSKDLFKWWYAEILATFTLLLTVLVLK